MTKGAFFRDFLRAFLTGGFGTPEQYLASDDLLNLMGATPAGEDVGEADGKRGR